MNPVSSPPPVAARPSGYRLRLSASPADLHAAQALRFQVFNLELQEGLAASYGTQRDADHFDAQCDHLLVEETGQGLVVGTYRMQTGLQAAAGHGYYSAQEFDFSPYEPLRPHLLELGRACILQGHRSLAVLSLLWRGVAAYAREHNARWLIGCSSLTSQDPALGWAAARLLEPHLVAPELRTVPLPAYTLPAPGPEEAVVGSPPKLPRLLAAYLSLGAQICGPPALDREFKTIDFLTLMDLDALPERVRQRWEAGNALPG
jgi:putative hemolysin